MKPSSFYRNYLFAPISVSQLRPRHFAVFMLFLYILLECIVVGLCITPGTKSAYVAKLTYVASDNTEYFYSGSISQLNVRVGYFSTCIQAQTPNNKGLWSCLRNETELLLRNPNYNASSPADQDLKNFFKDTAYMFRHDCMSPWLLVVAILISFLLIFFFAIQPPNEGLMLYTISTVTLWTAFSLSLVAAVWQETNTLTGTKLMKVMVDDYFSLKTHYGDGARALVWVGVALTGLGFFSLLVLTLGSVTLRMQEYRGYGGGEFGKF